jgi:perosamine synthetase
VIPVFKPKMNTKKILSELEVIMDSGWIGLGPKTMEFEQKFADYIGVKYAVGVNSATSALHLSVHALNLAPGDEVIVPSMTFASTGLAVLYAGATPVFADILPDTLCLDPDDIVRKITDKTKAIIPVHFGGHSCLMDEILNIANAKNLAVIEDNAHGCGGKYKNKMLGSVGLMGCFSFHAVKNLSTGDGGMITTDDKKLYDKLKKLRWLGIDKDTWGRSNNAYAWQYSIDELGFKCHMNDITAVIGLAQLETLDHDNDRRKVIFDKYNDLLGETCWLELPSHANYTKSACHNYVIKTPFRNELNTYMSEHGISTGVHYEPIHHHKVFNNGNPVVPLTNEVWPKLLTLPLFPDLTDDDVVEIASCVINFGKEHAL